MRFLAAHLTLARSPTTLVRPCQLQEGVSSSRASLSCSILRDSHLIITLISPQLSCKVVEKCEHIGHPVLATTGHS